MKQLIQRTPRPAWLLLAAAASIGAMIVLYQRLGATNWAGLGQWVGGLGALFAAWAALDIAKREARHRAESDAHQDFVRANFITMHLEGDDDTLVISNRGAEPVIMIAVTAYNRWRSSPDLEPERIPLQGLPVDILMPMLPPFTSVSQAKIRWQVDPMTADSMWTKEKLLKEHPGELEIEFTDLHGNRWARSGDHPARPAPPSILGEVARKRLTR